MTTQVTSIELTAERPEMVRGILELIVADSISTLVESDEGYSHLTSLFIQPGEDIVENYKSTTAGIFLFDEYRQLLPLVDQVVGNIGADLFTDMLDTDENSAYSEVLRCFGHGVSFWDSWDYKDFGFSEMPRLKTTLESPYDIATQILDKIAERQIANEMLNVDEYLSSMTNFDIWLSQNYIPAGEASDGEEWYLSTHPNEFMPFPLSSVKQKWVDEKYIQELPGSHLLNGVIVENLTEEEATELNRQIESYEVLTRSSSGHPITLPISEERIIVDTERSSNIY